MMAKDDSPLAGLMQQLSKEMEKVGEIKTSDELEYPLEIHDLQLRPIKRDYRGLYPGPAIGSMVSVRPIAEKYKDKTFLGVYIGDLPIELIASFQVKTKTIVASAHANAAIFVPELNKIIYGIESWWGIIKSEEQLRQITNYDIENVWYVKAFQDLLETQKQTPETKA